MTDLNLIISPPPIEGVSSDEQKQLESRLLPMNRAKQFEAQSSDIESKPTPCVELIAIGGLLAASIANAVFILTGQI